MAAASLVVAGGCSWNQSPTTVASGPRSQAPLDAEVTAPSGFPADFPTYPHARLVAAASFPSSGQVVWGMEWETLDVEPKVAAFYTKQLGQGDWVLTGTSSPNGDFAATFARRSDKNAHGTVYTARSETATKILVSLVSRA